MDVFCVAGEGCSVEAQQRADVPARGSGDRLYFDGRGEHAELSDGKKAGGKIYDGPGKESGLLRQIDFLKKDLKLSMVVNPELIVAGEITEDR